LAGQTREGPGMNVISPMSAQKFVKFFTYLLATTSGVDLITDIEKTLQGTNSKQN
jgi:hypothetical protein